MLNRTVTFHPADYNPDGDFVCDLKLSGTIPVVAGLTIEDLQAVAANTHEALLKYAPPVPSEQLECDTEALVYVVIDEIMDHDQTESDVRSILNEFNAADEKGREQMNTVLVGLTGYTMESLVGLAKAERS